MAARLAISRHLLRCFGKIRPLRMLKYASVLIFPHVLQLTTSRQPGKIALFLSFTLSKTHRSLSLSRPHKIPVPLLPAPTNSMRRFFSPPPVALCVLLPPTTCGPMRLFPPRTRKFHASFYPRLREACKSGTATSRRPCFNRRRSSTTLRIKTGPVTQ